MPLFIFLPSPSWCETHRCECPCHSARFYDTTTFLLLAMALTIWVFFTFIFWAWPFRGSPTLVDVIRGQWCWLVSLMGRVY